jgi:RNA polymerase sigma-70 factor, ECF subfamily
MVDPVARPDARPTDDDARLLARLVAGDERALGSLYDSYGAVVYGLALAITQDSPTAESVVTDAFAVLWREARSVQRPATSLFAWLSHTVRERALARRSSATATALAQPPAASALAMAIARLSPVERQSVELAYFGGLTRAEIARALGETEVTIAVALRTAMDGLRGLVAPPSSQVTPRMVASV